MKINRSNALDLWERTYGASVWAKDFHGSLMYKDAYGDDKAWAYPSGYSSYTLGSNSNFAKSLVRHRIYCGWNIHHILPKANGGTSEKFNLICTNITTNREAEDKITFWIGDCNYQV